MRRADRRPAGAWIRDAWLADEALGLIAGLHASLTGTRHPMLTALEAGSEVVGRLYELPEVLGDRLRSEGWPAHSRWRLTADDGLELA